ncbi:PepSY domain-containing protein [Streptomyces sp. NPDC005774]|uniref:PepSY domain-containing protein n=1 Tax=Streptomyces sp. NPDC005774 TaxID=3364728 RepID=UPI0036CCE459
MKRNIVIAVVTAAALVGGGTATAIAVSGDDEPTSTNQVDTWASDDDDRAGDRDDRRGDDGDDDRDDLDDLDDDDARALSADVTAAEAVSAALKHRSGTAVSVEMDDDDDDEHRGKAAWEVDILGGGDTWYSVWIDPSSGKVLGSERDDDDDDAAKVRAALKGMSVTAEEAAKAAAAKGTVTSVDLDDDDTKGWEVETVTAGGDDREWLVGPNSGKVTADDDDSDDRDDRGDDGRDDDADDRNDHDGDDDRDDR